MESGDFEAREARQQLRTNSRWDRAILVLSEVHGIHFPNIQLLADAPAAVLECPVVAEFRGDHHPRHCGTNSQYCFELDVAASFRVKALGAIGYCFGGRYVIRLLDKGRVKAGVVNHPSFLYNG
ncbi:hypothetical protein PRK78_002799 [Emydomyces testavorans]|uniref:Dienelactone hydrolase domain-containing protein n=1 Tax=Emydomyces testavorans TaxID=2070801 RepID=A0AAF0DFS5_9EURO|nr:hypothetical protein PRK78_002799 [Emydomyces testavorans]